MAAPSQYPRKVELPYRWRDVDGSVRLEMRENDDPGELGCPELGGAFPGWTLAPGFSQHPLEP